MPLSPFFFVKIGHPTPSRKMLVMISDRVPLVITSNCEKKKSSMLSLEEVSAITYKLGEFSFIFAMMSFFLSQNLMKSAVDFLGREYLFSLHD